MSNHPVPTPPTKISLSNLYPESDHPDVAVFQAAFVRNLDLVRLPITGVYDQQTTTAVAVTALIAQSHGTDITLRYPSNLPTEDFVRLVGLEVRR